MIRSAILRTLLAIALALGAGAAHAAQTVGSFILGSAEQKFGDGRGRFASTMNTRASLSLRCDWKADKLAVSISGFDPAIGHLRQLQVAVIIDGKPLLTTTASTPPISDYEKAAQRNGWAVAIGWGAGLADSEKVIEALRGASSVAFHVKLTDLPEFDLAFPLTGSAAAVDYVKAGRCTRPNPEESSLPEAGNWEFGLTGAVDSNTRGGLTIPNNTNMVYFYCMADDNWNWFIARRYIGKGFADYSDPKFSYSVDDAAIKSISARSTFGKGRLDFDKADAQAFLSNLLDGKSKLAFSVGVTSAMTMLDLGHGLIADDIRRLAEHCPLGPEP